MSRDHQLSWCKNHNLELDIIYIYEVTFKWFNIHCRVPEKEWSFQDGGRASLFKVGLVVWMQFCRLLCIIASIEYIRRQTEESFTSCIKGLIRKFTEIHILTVQSGVNKRNKNRGEHSFIKHRISIHSYIPVIQKYHGNQM